MKRKLSAPDTDNKRLRVPDSDGASPAVPVTRKTANASVPPEPQRPRGRIHKLAPVRPFPTVPRSVSATGPQSAHKEGKNLICITRKTPLSVYLRRCKDVILKDGYKTLHLSAMGAAIPLLLQLAVALPPILPFAADEIETQMTTGTMEVQDEILPDDEDEDITYRTRAKSTLLIVLKIGDGEFEGDTTGPVKRGPGLPKQKPPVSKPLKPAPSGSRMVVAEPDQEDMEI